MARAILLLRDLTVDDWTRPVDPPELDGWTVHDVVVHLVANESLLALQLGVPVLGSPRPPPITRAAPLKPSPSPGRPPAQAVAELEAAAEATATEIAAAAKPVSTSGSIGGGGVPTWMAVLVRLRDLDACRRHPQGDRGRHGGPATGFAAHDGSRRLRPRAELAAARRLPSRADRPVPLHRPWRRRAWDIDLGPAGAVRPAGDDAVDAEIVTEAAAICRGISARSARLSSSTPSSATICSSATSSTPCRRSQ